jgi:hypothetical protein
MDMALRDTLYKAHELLKANQVDHALIGGLALATLGVNRATADVDMLIDEHDRSSVIELLTNNGFRLKNHTEEVLHFAGTGNLVFLLARRPLSKGMLESAKPLFKNEIKCVSAENLIGLKIPAYSNDSRRELQDKADIKNLISVHEDLNWERIKKYADLFDQWEEIKKIRDLS